MNYHSKHLGRPSGKLTKRRKEILEYWRQYGPVSLGKLARDCHIFDRSTARRFLITFEKMGILQPPRVNFLKK